MKYNALFVFWSCVFCLAANNCCVSSSKDDIAKELKSMEKGLPLPYHVALDKTVRQLDGKSLPKTFVKYEAFIDSALLQRQMPLELKYLPYALSGMKVLYTQGDRCGYWALPSLVGMHYGLNVDENSDERFLIEAETVAALDYLNDLHSKYNDWWYSILAYTNSPTSLSHALIHHGKEPAIWDFYENNLMPNTQVIADFIACVYLGSQGRLDFTDKTIEPYIYKKAEPKDKDVKSDETPASKVTEPFEAMVKKTSQKTGTSNHQQTQDTKTITYKIKKGDTLSGIAIKYHVTVADLKKWNHLDNDNIFEGKTLIIKK